MEAKRSWWQQIKKHPVLTVLILLLAVVIVLIILSILGYIFNWGWTGLNATDFTSTPQNITRTIVYQPGKTLWDWLGLLGVLAIPVVVGFGAAWFSSVQQQRDKKLADQRAVLEHELVLDNQREDALQAYIDKMSELLLVYHLRESTEDKAEVRKIARVRTLTILRRLDAKRKGSVLKFLQEANLIDKDKRFVDLNGADLSLAELYGADLRRANLSGADLSGADLREAKLGGADLSEAYMLSANLTGAYLSHADLRGAVLALAILDYAKLTGSNITQQQLDRVRSCEYATLPQGLTCHHNQ
jgi:uncharacterized protein YjbI with pentapeptide repeats